MGAHGLLPLTGHSSRGRSLRNIFQAQQPVTPDKRSADRGALLGWALNRYGLPAFARMTGLCQHPHPQQPHCTNSWLFRLRLCYEACQALKKAP